MSGQRRQGVGAVPVFPYSSCVPSALLTSGFVKSTGNSTMFKVCLRLTLSRRRRNSTAHPFPC